MMNESSSRINNPFVGSKEGNIFKPVMNSRRALRVALSSPSLASQDFQQRLSRSTLFKTREEKTEEMKDNTDANCIDWLDSATSRLFQSKITDVAEDFSSSDNKDQKLQELGNESPEKETKLNIRKRIPCKLFDYGKGMCVYGSSCHYSHDRKSSESETGQDLKRSPSGFISRRNSSMSKTPCSFYDNGRGHCEYGMQCKFSHAPEKNSFNNAKGHRRSQSEHLRKQSNNGTRKFSPSKQNTLLSPSGDNLCNGSTDILKSPSSTGNIYSILSESEAETPVSVARKTTASRVHSNIIYTTTPSKLTRTDSTVSNSRKPCKNFNFGYGSCPFGVHCHFLHVDEDGTPLEDDYDPLQGIEVDSNVAMMFKNPYGQGDICAAAVIPYLKHNGRVWAMILVEDKYDRSVEGWRPALSMFGGKVNHKDMNWLATAARKFAGLVAYKYGVVNDIYFARNYNNQDSAAEQTCTASDDDKLHNIPSEIAGFGENDESVQMNAQNYTSYLQQSKLQVLYFPLSPEKVTTILDTHSLENVDYLHLFDCRGKPKNLEEKEYYTQKIYLVSLVKDNDESSGGYKINPNCFETEELPHFRDGVLLSALQLATFVDYK